MKCTLSEEINECPFFEAESSLCNNQDECTFQERMKDNSKHYKREERWYEKYYK